MAKPLREILAGIATIAYGLFALLTVGPFLVDVFGTGGVLSMEGLRDGGPLIAGAILLAASRATCETMIVAFVPGLTLFVLLLGSNIIALYILRKYREQYE